MRFSLIDIPPSLYWHALIYAIYRYDNKLFEDSEVFQLLFEVCYEFLLLFSSYGTVDGQVPKHVREYLVDLVVGDVQVDEVLVRAEQVVVHEAVNAVVRQVQSLECPEVVEEAGL